ncbi:MAG: CinA family protein [Betaproteobacteria bacterium]|nr:CinA family protein [Betaproteobacteria bacterium]
MNNPRIDSLDLLAARVGAALKARGWRLTTAESCTGGGIAEAITRISGSSTWFDYGFVTYSNAAKISLLGVGADTLAAHGAVSEEVARQMAEGALLRAGAEISVAVTGIAGPDGGTAEKPVGTVCFAWARQNEATQTETRHFDGTRAEVRRQTVIHALNKVLHNLT